MNDKLLMAALLTTACLAAPSAQTSDPPQASVPGEGLRELDAVTFACPKAGLNAAAREAAKAPSDGAYQFSFFRMISDSHHAAYEVHFKSNVESEPVLRYCVEIYCQQGWDPKTTKATVTLLTKQRPRKGGMTHGAACVDAKARARAPAKRSVSQ